MLKFAERLKELRTEKGLSQRKLAKLVGVSDKAISLWENNERVPNLDAAKALAVYFKVSIDYLAGLED
ncbi:MAG: helix-turn-helix transcriptional regulator [Clostridia bacterium]|nr:helix-turn-helix transcriptional regulator [Clostridia bacterium]